MGEEVMVKLKPKFQKEIFYKLIDKYDGSLKASKELKIPASSVRNYKNLYFKSVPKKLLDKFILMKLFTIKDLNENTLATFNKKDLINFNLDAGRKKRNDQLREFKKDLPKLKEIIIDDYIDVSIWLKKYLPLLNIGFRKVNLVEKKEFFILKYFNFTKSGYKNFEVKLPKKIKIDEELIYFFGLWCGDRSGGKRFGVCNKNMQLINFTRYFLKKHYQKVEKILYISKGIQEPNIQYNKKFIINKKGNGWVLSTHSKNGIFATFFHYLSSNLEYFLKNIKNKYPFFAGLFDAEGNVSLYNKSLRWACKNEDLIKVYSKNLKELGLFDRYDGNCIITYNVDEFHHKIIPYMKHLDKINLTKFLCKGEGNLPRDHQIIINFIKSHENKTAKEIAKALKKKKVYSELRLLCQFGFITKDNYPYKYQINSKGLKSLGV